MFTFYFAGLAVVSALSCYFLLDMMIKNKQRILQPIRSDGPQSHVDDKSKVPTLGGVALLITFSALLFFSSFISIEAWFVYGGFLGCGLVGLLDDVLKIRHGNTRGLSGKIKLLAQFSLVIALLAIVPFDPIDQLLIYFAWLDIFPYWILYFGQLVMMVYLINCVNLADGLDGMITMPIGLITATIAWIILDFSLIQQGFYIDIFALLASFLPMLLAFLWFNAHPASIFMGDSGSLALGGLVVFLAVSAGHHIALIIAMAGFIAEGISVVLQVGYFKLSRRLYGEPKRLFRMAPLHHHFELGGMKETKIVTRFWIITILACGLALSVYYLFVPVNFY